MKGVHSVVANPLGAAEKDCFPEPRIIAHDAREVFRGDWLKSMTQTWRAFWRLSGLERGIAVEAAVALLATRAGLRIAGFQRWKTALGWLMPTRAGDSGARPELTELARMIARTEAAAARHLFFHSSCLERSLVLWWLLGRRGIAADLRIGARKDAGCFEAHAWVEYAGTVLNGSGEEHFHFVPFDSPITPMETRTR